MYPQDPASKIESESKIKPQAKLKLVTNNESENINSEKKFKFCHIEFLDSTTTNNVLNQTIKIDNKPVIMKRAKRKSMNEQKIKDSIDTHKKNLDNQTSIRL